jgi:membrane protease YdiL (CAAX protease family)
MKLGHLLLVLYALMILSILVSLTRYKRYALLAELVCFFVGVPLTLSFSQQRLMVWLIINFCCVCLALIYTVHTAPHLLTLIARQRPISVWPHAWTSFLGLFVLRTLVMGLVLTVITRLIKPEALFGALRSDPVRWLWYLGLYGLLSAFPQEFAYRKFFFARYRELFPSSQAMILASSLSFTVAHLIFRNVLCLVLTFLAGYLIASSYARYRSWLFAGLEHALYGWMTFVIGLGAFFGG